MFRGFLSFSCTLLIAGVVAAPARAFDTPGTGADESKTVVYRDTWGVPHIYAPTAVEGLYAMGWAQAQDRPDQLLENIARAIGESAKFEGKGAIQSDLRSLLFDHYGVAQKNFAQLSPTLQEHMRALARGMTAYYQAHPEDVPAWWGDRVIDEYMIIAFGRMFLYNWSIDDAYGDLERGGIQPGFDREQRGSNQFAVGPKRSAVGAPILYIDPHLAWFGPSRFWEVRIHAGELHGSGFTLPGSPYVGLGHNADVAWAMTTGGPDTADVFELTLQDDKAKKYQYDGEWRDLASWEVTVQVKDGEPYKTTLYTSHLGPIIAIHGTKAYAAAMAYQEVVELNEAWYKMNVAKDYNGIKEALATLAMFPQNIMVADNSGNIYYQRTGRVPMRPEGYDWSKPVPGDTSKSAWTGFHPASDLVQVENPEQGYMQNCNIPPDAMMIGSPLTPDKFKDYIYGDIGYGPRGGWSNQRGARAVQLLSQDDSVTIEEALAYAVDTHPYGVERWIDTLRAAHEKFGADLAGNADYAKGIEDLLAWNQELAADSTAALKYVYWKQQLVADYGEDVVKEAASVIDHPEYIALGKAYEPVQLGEEELQGALQSLANAMATLKSHFGSLDAKYGDKFRVGRDDKSWPVGGGGGNLGITTLRNVNFGRENADHTQWGRSGQTSTQIVVLTKPVQSWTYVPIGQSDRPNSKHYSDQAEKLFSTRTMKPTWWLPEALYANIESREVVPTPEAAVATAPAGETVVGLAGTWDITMTMRGTDVPATMQLEVTDGKLSGSWEDRFGKDALYDFSLSKGELSFGRDVTYEGQDYAIDFKGTVVEDSLKGTFYTEAGPLEIKGTRKAPASVASPTPAPAAAATSEGPAGTWKLTMSFQGSEMPATMILEQKDGKLAGSWEDEFGKDDLSDIGESGGVLKFGRQVTYEGSEYDITFEGKRSGNDLTGTFYTEAGPLEVKGSRESVPAPAAATASSSVAGAWKLTMSFQGSDMSAKMLLEEKEGKLTGSWEDDFGKDELTDIVQKSDVLTFGRQVTYDGSEYDITFEGKLSGDALTGTFYTEAGPLEIKGNREAAAAPAASAPAPDALSGTWNIVATFEGSKLPSTMLVSKSADGNYQIALHDEFGTAAPTDVKFADGVLSFNREIEYQGESHAITFEGNVQGDTIKGGFETEIGTIPVEATRAAAAETPKAVPVIGKWEATVEYQGESFPATLTIEQGADGALAGTWSDQFSTTPPTDIAFKEGVLTFTRKIMYQGTEYELSFEGKLEGGKLEGAYQTEIGPLAVKATRAAVPQAAAPAPVSTPAPAPAPAPEPVAKPNYEALLGEWEVSIDFQGTSFPAKMSFTQGEDGALTGTWEDEYSKTPPEKIVFESGNLKFERTVDYQGQKYVIDFKGKVEGDALQGEFSTEMGPLPMTAKRKSSPQAEATPDAGPFLGNWDVIVNLQGSELAAEMSISQSQSGELSGTWSDEYSKSAPYNVRLKGDQLLFDRKVEIQGQEYVIAFEGKVKGDELVGRYVTEMGNLELTGKRAAATAAPSAGESSLTGEWKVTTNSQLGTMERTMLIRPDQSGWYGTPDQQFPILNLKIEGGQVGFEVTVNIQDTDVPLVFKGTLSGASLKGEFESPYGNATVDAVRQLDTATAAGDPKTEINALLAAWKSSMEAADLDQAMTLYSEKFSADGNDKAAAKAYLQSAKDSGYLEGLEAKIDAANIVVDGATAEVRNVQISGTFGAFAIRFKVAHEGGKWLFTEQDQE